MAAEATTITTQQRTVTVGGATIAYVERGAGAPILMLHGSPDTHAMWQPVIDRLSEGARCIAIDLPGFGGSTLPADFSLSLDHMADFLHELAAALAFGEPVVLLTTDFGGHYGLAYAAKYPDEVRGVAVSNTNFFHDYRWHSFAQMYRMPGLGELLLATSNKKVIANTLKSYSPALPDSYLSDSFDAGFGSAAVRRTILRMYRERDSADFVGWEDRWLAYAASKPVIVLWGDKDPFITPGYAERFGGEVHHFAQYGHWLALEAPDGYVEALRPWLAKL